MFALAEQQVAASAAAASSHTATSTEKSVPADEELIEVLAQELQSTEDDLKAAQSRVVELESDLKSERMNKNTTTTHSLCNKSVGTTADTTSLTTSSSLDSTESIMARLHQIIENQRREIEKNKADAREGVEIMRDLEKALRVARSEKNASVLAKEEAIQSMEGYKRQMEGMQLELMGCTDELGRMEKSHREVKEEHSALLARYSNLESSLTELQNVLTVVQSRSEKKAAAMTQALSEAEEREEKSVLEYQTLKKKYDEVQGQCGEMEGVLTDMTVRFEEMKDEVTKKEDELEMAEARHEISVEEMKRQCIKEAKRKEQELKEEARVLYEAMLAKNNQEHAASIKEIRLNFEQQLREKDELLKAREKQWLAESRETEQVLSRHKSEYTKLKSENSELSRKIERGITMYNEATSQLKARTAEASTAASSKGSDVELIAVNKALKRDLTSAVESSISRGKQIQALEKEIESYQAKLAKVNQKLKRMEQGAPSTPTKSEDIDVLRSEVVALRARAREAEKEKQQLEEKLAAFIDIQTKSAKDERLQLDSKVGHLEQELKDARHALDESKSRILSLEEALQETEMVLRTVSSARLKGSTPTSSPGVEPFDCSEAEIRRQIEKDVLKEYIGERL